MYTTIIHPLRKAYCLSITEYCVLEAVRGLANNQKYEGWCVMSFDRIAESLDLSRITIIRSFDKLIKSGLLIKRKQTLQDTAVRTTDEWNEWFMTDKADLLLSMKTKDVQITTIQPRNKSDTTSIKMIPPQYQNDTTTSIKMIPNTNKDTNKDTLLPKGNTEQAPKYGNEEINKMLEACCQRIGIDSFASTKLQQRNFGRHLVGLFQRLGSEEFLRRLDILRLDAWKYKRMNEVDYLYRELKGFIQPQVQKQKSNIAIIS